MAAKIKVIHDICPYCKKPVSSDQAGVEYVKTKSKKEIIFHLECYKREGVFKRVTEGESNGSGK